MKQPTIFVSIVYCCSISHVYQASGFVDLVPALLLLSISRAARFLASASFNSPIPAEDNDTTTGWYSYGTTAVVRSPLKVPANLLRDKSVARSVGMQVHVCASLD